MWAGRTPLLRAGGAGPAGPRHVPRAVAGVKCEYFMSARQPPSRSTRWARLAVGAATLAAACLARADWQAVGTAGFSAGTAFYTSLAIHNGEPYVAYSDGGSASKATVMRYTGGSWQTVGSAGFSAGAISYTALAISSTGEPYVAFRDAANGNEATVMACSGGTWQIVGAAAFSDGAVTYTCLALYNDEPYVAYSDAANGSRVTVMRYTGGAWQLVGSAGFSAGAATYLTLAINSVGEPHVAYVDAGTANRSTVMKYTGGSWQNVGAAGFSPAAVTYTALTLDGNDTPYVSFQDGSHGNKATCMKYSAGSWSYVGSFAFSTGIAILTAVGCDAAGKPYVIYGDQSNGTKATVMRYAGGTWSLVGTGGFSTGQVDVTSIRVLDGDPYVAFADSGQAWKCVVMKYVGVQAPTLQANNVTCTSAATNQLALSWTRGDGSRCAVFMKQGDTGTPAPVNTITYTANAAFGSGTQIGTSGWYCVYDGTGTSVTVTGLAAITEYRAMVCEYNGTAGDEHYYAATAAGNPLNQYTVPAAPAAQAATGTTASGFSANWSASAGATGYRLDVATDSGFTSYVAGYQNLDVGNVTTYVVSGLSPNTAYHYRVRAYNTGGSSADSGTIDVTTLKTLATVTTTAVTNVTHAAADSGGNVTADGGDAVTARGVCWNTTGTPTTADDKTTDGVGTGSYTSSLTGLAPSTTYYVRAYATNGQGTAYGDERSFETLATTPTLTTTAITNITVTTADSGGEVTNDGGTAVTARGVCWNTTGTPTTADSKTTDGAGAGSYASSLTGLAPGVTYYVRAYATNAEGTAYGNERNFTTLKTLATVTTTAVTNVTHAAADSGGNVTADGGDAVTARGVCWNTAGAPTTADDKTTNGSGTGSFTSSLTGLSPATIYYVRAYATNGQGTAYGDERSFTTDATTPTLTTTAVTNIAITTADSGGDITADGGAAVTARGVCWNTTGTPTTANSKTTDGGGSGSYTSNLTGLLPGTTYYVRAYATNNKGTAYGQQLSLTTLTTTPTVTTAAVAGVTTTAAQSGGNVTSDGGAAVAARGVCWNTVGTPTTADAKTSNGTGKGNFTSNLTGLTPATTYYVRAYATNAQGTAYGGELSFTTPAVVVPTVTTSAVANVTTRTADCGGEVTADGGAAVTARGVCWNTAGSPTNADDSAVGGTGTGSFTCDVSGLAPGTTYFMRAYATNSAGTAYGDEVSFTTVALTVPTVTTAAVSSVTTTTARAGGRITTNGGSVVTARGVCWNTAGDPTVADETLDSGAGSGRFSCDLARLSPATTYYIRAYATNAIGTAYGTTVMFTTAAEPDDANEPAPVLEVQVVSATDASDALTGDDVQFVVAVSNAGVGRATAVAVTITYPASAELLSISAGGIDAEIADEGAGFVTVLIGELPPDGSVELDLTFRALAAGALVVSATVSAAEVPAVVAGESAEVAVEDEYYVVVTTHPLLGICGPIGLTPLLVLGALYGVRRAGWCSRKQGRRHLARHGGARTRRHERS